MDASNLRPFGDPFDSTTMTGPIRDPHYILSSHSRRTSTVAPPYRMSQFTVKDEEDTRPGSSEYSYDAQEVIEAVTGAAFDDPNYDESYLSDEDFDEESPYPEVRAAVANTDDPEMPASTLRVWIIGMFWSIILSAVNQFFYFRYPSVQVGGIVAQLLTYPIGVGIATWTPRWRVLGVQLNPGPFSIKEHVLITIMASIGSNSAYAADIINVQRVYYNQRYNFAYQWFIVISTQLIGFSIGGAMKRFLVSPPSMIWPSNLVTCALFNTLHSQQYAGIGTYGGPTRLKFFWIVFGVAFAWYFVPGYLFTALSYFSWVTWIRPNDPVIAQLFGYVHGLGMSLITFDWNQIAYVDSPLVTPWWTQANIMAGFVFFIWIITPILYFTNTWYGKYMPISSSTSFDNTMQSYNVTRILDDKIRVDRKAYGEYSPLYMTTTMAVAYGMSFAAMTATISHAFIFFRKQIWIQCRRSLNEQPDIHARLMAKYRPVPDWWYLCIFGVMFTFGVVSIEIWPTDMPVWAFVLALAIAVIYILPVGILQAITNQQVGLNVITELIIGYALPGRPVAMMMFKTWGYISMAQGLDFTSDFKLGHYMKIPPRPMFWAQVITTVIASTVQLGVQEWMFANIDGMCTPKQKDSFVCAGTEVFGTASIIWGVIGPERQFSKGQIYYPLVYFFLIGAILPVIQWALNKRYPHTFLRYVNFPVIFNGTGSIPPATAINFIPSALVGFVFQHIIRRKYFSWWAKYNYVLSAALDAGTAVSVIVIYFCLQYPMNGTIGLAVQGWWGNTVPWMGADAGPDGYGTPVVALGEGDIFGPKTW
ncbi:OPT oligopeptide transporter [Cylindrobasidium torrendii FP15055 ss-10]|uniref:OPT oligopeptide transporter n=1 Tax=Cylindrobasidium torrendii FP15055 ss-10 TaxID=1314674 RepID=A0A0D7B0Y3_9AGAR|nr:OPT oligopeptide transporter [Cylindrobasidium torrendii FP15055 ss-10]